MGVSAELVLDGVSDVDRLIGAMTVPDTDAVGHRQRIIPELDNAVFSVRPVSWYGPDYVKVDRAVVNMNANYWYPGESHYSPGNWHSIADTCRFIWAIEPTIVIHYIPEPDWIGDIAAADLIAAAHLLTPAVCAELDVQCAHAEESQKPPA
ncbi:hypothetical protein ACM0AZ_24970 [Mycobacteroides abscessus subsp. massiliense]|uniref:hypothetical protein n=1 Tax=Mycobacteroides abscessus TaxID=36809 RepID=UPI0019CFE5F0|nr:hypothetical protein [Mycobacteroides abscessus]MBN7567087.1 hypothetical protein [Mycobacteroides abscessus subsp. massiliense]